MQAAIHYFLHFGFPLIISLLFFRKDWETTYLILLCTMLVDLDHLLVEPVFQANRCSIQFHLLHTYPAIAFYLVLLFFKRPWNIIGLGLVMHMATDLLDCVFMYLDCQRCYAGEPFTAIIRFFGG